MANSRGRWWGEKCTECQDSPEAAPCSIGKTSPPGSQRPHPPADTALLSTARRGGAEPFFPLLFLPHFTLTLLRNGKWPPLPPAAATTTCPGRQSSNATILPGQGSAATRGFTCVRGFPGRCFCRRFGALLALKYVVDVHVE